MLKSNMKKKSPIKKKPTGGLKKTNQIEEEDLNFKEVIELYKNKVNSLEIKLSGLVNENRELRKELIQSEKEKVFALDQKNQIVTYLTQELNSKANEMQNLNARIESFNATKEFNQKKFEAILASRELEYKNQLETLSSVNLQLETKLTNVQEFIIEKVQLEAKLKEYLNVIENLKEEYKKSIYEMEKENLVEKKNLKQELVERLNELAKEFRSAFHQQISESTKKIVRENHLLTSNIKKITETTNLILDENEKLKEKEKKNKMEIQYFEKNEEYLSKKYSTSIKLIQMFTESNCDEIDHLVETKAKEISELKRENSRIKNELIALNKLIETNSFEKENNNCNCETNMKKLIKTKEKLVDYLKATSDYILNELETGEFKLELMKKIESLVSKLNFINIIN